MRLVRILRELDVLPPFGFFADGLAQFTELTGRQACLVVIRFPGVSP